MNVAAAIVTATSKSPNRGAPTLCRARRRMMPRPTAKRAIDRRLPQGPRLNPGAAIEIRNQMLPLDVFPNSSLTGARTSRPRTNSVMCRIINRIMGARRRTIPSRWKKTMAGQASIARSFEHAKPKAAIVPEKKLRPLSAATKAAMAKNAMIAPFYPTTPIQ